MWHQILQSFKKKQVKSDIWYMPGELWDKVIGLTDELLVQCDVPVVKILHCIMRMIMIMIANKF